MSRSYHQRHKTYRNRKYPRTILDIIFENGKRKLIFRKRKIKPYGRKNFIGYGEETYSKKYGEYFETVTNKTRERMNIKKYLKELTR